MGETQPTLTGLRRVGTSRVALEVDGRPWRTVPEEAVLRAGLAAGLVLDRPRLRRFRSELRRVEARTVATRALDRRDLSAQRLEERLRRAGVAPATRAATVERLSDVGLVDDGRLARTRAAALAARGWGDAAIADRLEREGIDESLARAAVSDLEPEAERATALVDEDDFRRSARLLARRGFSDESVESALGRLDAEP